MIPFFLVFTYEVLLESKGTLMCIAPTMKLCAIVTSVRVVMAFEEKKDDATPVFLADIEDSSILCDQ